VREITEMWIREKNSSITMNLGRLPYPEIEPVSFWGSTYKLRRILGAM